MNRIKKKLAAAMRSREVRMAVMMCLVGSLLTVAALAEGETTGGTIDSAAIVTAFSSGFQTMVVNSISMISAMVPIGLSLAGILFMVKKAMKWFKGVANG